MGQQHRIVNLDKKQVLDPKLVGSSRRWAYFAFTESPAMGGLLWLLNGNWSGDRMAIVSNRADDADLPLAEEVCGIPASQLCFPTVHGHERFKNVSRKVRDALAEDYGYRFQVNNTITTTITENGPENHTSSSVRALAHSDYDRDPVALADEDRTTGFVVINRDKGQFLTSWTFSHDTTLRQSIVNLWDDEEGKHSWLPTALAVLLTTSMEGTNYAVPGFSGAWAGDHISVEDYDTADKNGLENISGDLRANMSDVEPIDLSLALDHTEGEEDYVIGSI